MAQLRQPAATLLVVDDDPTVNVVVEHTMRPEGHKVLAVSGVSEALDVLETKAVDVVLCDVLMPGSDGYSLCRTMRDHARFRFIPILLVTTLSSEADVVAGFDAGAFDFLSKPVLPPVLVARVRSMLGVATRLREVHTSNLDELLQARKHQLATSAGLSPREREVLDLVLLGRMHADIALVLGVSPRTVKFHVRNLLEKLGADSRADLPRVLY